MKTWVVGDLHGCEETLDALLEAIQFGPRDRLICIGDLINRGPRSAQILDRFCDDRRFSVILGNHDWAFILSTLVRSGPVHEDFRSLASSSRAEFWIAWLRKQPFALTLGKDFLVHAGLWPHWSLETHQSIATELHTWFQSCSSSELRILDGYLPQALEENPADRLQNPLRFFAFAMNVLTKIRYLSPSPPLRLAMDLKGPPSLQPEALPWYEEYSMPKGYTVIFGHWSALQGLDRPGFQGLDTGCVWGEALTAFELSTRQRVTIASLERR